MAVEVQFGNKKIIESGAYARILSGQKAGFIDASFGNVLIIDTGLAAGYGGAGINGELTKGKSAIKTFEDTDQLKSFLRGGKLFNIADYLGKPAGDGVNGVALIHLIHARTTAAASMTLAFAGGGANGGSFTVKTKREGLGANGSQEATTKEVLKGYSWRMSAGVEDTAKFVIEFLEGTYRGLDTDTDNKPYDGIAEVDSIARVVAQSPEFNNTAELDAWMDDDFNFNQFFKKTASTISGTGVVVVADLAAAVSAFDAGTNNASGGTESYETTDLDAVLNSIAELDYSFVLSDKYADNAQDASTVKLLSHINNDTNFEKIIVIGGGNDSTKLQGTNSSVETAQFYDSESVVVVHSGVTRFDPTSFKIKEGLPSIYHAAMVLGRAAGLEPQVPLTFKELDVIEPTHDLNDIERKIAIRAGVLFTKNVDGFWVINQGYNTLQNNKSLLVNDPIDITHDITIKRIKMQLNKELILNIRNPNTGLIGKNKGTVSSADVETFIEGYLETKTVRNNVDNLIISARNIQAEIIEDYFTATYEANPNSPINKGFITGYFRLDI